MEGKGNAEEASKLFLQAWNEATNDFEEYIAAYYVARHQDNVPAKLKWLETANDPNVTDKKFPGNPTRSYRSQAPLKIVGQVTDWVRQTPGELKKWREMLANVKGEIIN